jgi:GTP cyclohydrolase I
MILEERKRDKIKKLLLNKDKSVFDAVEGYEAITEEIIPALNKLIDICGGDSTSAGQEDTAYRVVKAWLEQTTGYDKDPARHLEVQFTDTFMEKKVDDLVIVKDIEFASVCEHHIMPFIGKIHIGYIPGDSVVGISKIPRMAKEFGKRMQLQERLGDDIATAMMKGAACQGVIVVIEAAHTCMIARGIEAAGTTTITSHTRGLFREKQNLEQTFLRAIGK